MKVLKYLAVGMPTVIGAIALLYLCVKASWNWPFIAILFIGGSCLTLISLLVGEVVLGVVEERLAARSAPIVRRGAYYSTGIYSTHSHTMSYDDDDDEKEENPNV